MDLSKRILIAGGAAGLALAFISRKSIGGAQAANTDSEIFAVSHTDEEWRARLTPRQFSVLRREGTERPFTSALNDEHRAGIFGCAGCALDLYSSDTKFDSGTGWPSFWQPLEKAVVDRHDGSFGMLRTEVHCSRCGGHLGHVFNDGPQPTGLRYCMNGDALVFKPAAA